MKIIKASNIYKEFYVKNQCEKILQGISAEFVQGATYAITGVSGTGKSTLLHILAGLEEPTAGQVLFDNQNIFQFDNTSRNHFLNKQIGLLFQQPYLIKELSVLENVMVPGLIAQKPFQECKARAEQLLQQVGIQDKKNQMPMSLSGGQQQRVALARALFNKPTFLLADEPTGNLDLETGKKITQLLLSLVKKNNMGLIVSTHDQYVAGQIGQVFVLQNGLFNKI